MLLSLLRLSGKLRIAGPVRVLASLLLLQPWPGSVSRVKPPAAFTNRLGYHRDNGLPEMYELMTMAR